MKKSLHSFNGGISITPMRHSKILLDAGVVCCCILADLKRLPEKLLIKCNILTIRDSDYIYASVNKMVALNVGHMNIFAARVET